MTAQPDELIATLREELVDLWSDFNDAVNFNMVRNLDPLNEGSGWSIRMCGLADRIASITLLVGSPSWENIQVDLLLNGWWDAVHAARGLDVPPFDRERAQAVLAARAASPNQETP